MAQSTVVNLLTQQTYPGPSGTLISFSGVSQPAAAYYLASRDLQTITWNVSEQFVGYISIEASLVNQPIDTDWFNVYDIDIENFKSGFHNLNGNFVWIRAVVTDWSQGIINLATASY